MVYSTFLRIIATVAFVTGIIISSSNVQLGAICALTGWIISNAAQLEDIKGMLEKKGEE